MTKMTKIERKAEQIRYIKKLIRLYERKSIEFSNDHDERGAIRMVNAQRLAAARRSTRPQPGGPPKQAPDGHWYIHAPHAHGTYQRVVPR